ncbi:MAG: hypothetical protein HY319_16370 [Armatimonadetes bacterium]|nr:hypothetical protein [Armatimonadota bacterium]
MLRRAHRRFHRLRGVRPVAGHEVEPGSASVREPPLEERARAGAPEVTPGPLTPEQALSLLPPATGAEPPPILRAYNASLQRAQQVSAGWYEERHIQHNVFFDDTGAKHVVTSPVSNPADRVSHLILEADGTIHRLSYERAEGPPDNTRLLLEDGLLGLLDSPPRRLSRFPGYRLRLATYQREGPSVVGLERLLYRFDPALQELICESPD